MVAADSSVPFSQVLAVLRTHWKRWLALVFLTTLIGVIAAWLLPRRYEAEAVVLPRGNERAALMQSLGSQLGGLAALAGLGGAEGGQRAEAIEMLQSQILAREFIEDNKLLPVLFASDWDTQRNAWRNARTINEGVALFDHRIRVVIEDRRTGLATVRITWKDPVQAAAWANELVRRANNELRQRAVTRAQGSIEYLKREARTAEAVDIQQALYRLMEDQYKTLLLANVSDDYALSVIDPAVASDSRQYVFPKRALFAFAGLFFGLVLVLIMAFIAAAQRLARADEDRVRP
jgi:uncharacterized protein involved in exopolysaccharide biosynthesis